MSSASELFARRELLWNLTLRELRGWLEGLRQEELARSARHFDPAGRDAAERLTRALINKILHRPQQNLKWCPPDSHNPEHRCEECEFYDGSCSKNTYAQLRKIALIRQLFGLEKREEISGRHLEMGSQGGQRRA